MELLRLQSIGLTKYRKAKSLLVPLDGFLVLIGPNGSGKSNIVDALRFLGASVRTGDFAGPVGERGGAVNISWKGDQAGRVSLVAKFVESKDAAYEWKVDLIVGRADYQVRERLDYYRDPESPPTNLLVREPGGEQWWWSTTRNSREQLAIGITECALSAAAKNAAFPGRPVYDQVRSWSFSDPNPGYLRVPSTPDQTEHLDFLGRNLATRLYSLQQSDPDRFQRVKQTLADVSGIDFSRIEVRQLEDGRLALAAYERGFQYPINQPALSSGTLRLLALATALADSEQTGLLAVEEPENYVHPGALEALMAHLLSIRERTQVVITTHSPVLLNSLRDIPEVVRVVAGAAGAGTALYSAPSREAILEALKESGFSLGDFYLSKGFRQAE